MGGRSIKLAPRTDGLGRGPHLVPVFVIKSLVVKKDIPPLPETFGDSEMLRSTHVDLNR